MPSPLSSVGALDSVIPLAAVRDLDRPADGSEAPFAGLMAQFTAVPPTAVTPTPTEVEAAPPSVGLDGVDAARATSLRATEAGTPPGQPETLREPKPSSAAPLPPEVPAAEARAAIASPAGPGTLLLPPLPAPIALPGPLAASAGPALPTPPETPSAVPLPAVPAGPQVAGLVEPTLPQPPLLPPALPPPTASSAPPAPGDASAPDLAATVQVSLAQPAPPAGAPRSAGPLEGPPVPLPKGPAQVLPWEGKIPETSTWTQAIQPETGETLKPVPALLPEVLPAVAPAPLPPAGIKALPTALPEAQPPVSALPSTWAEPASSQASSAEVQPQPVLLKGAVPLESRMPAPAGPTLMETPRSRAEAPEAPLALAKQLPPSGPVPPAAESTPSLPEPGLGPADPAPAARAIPAQNPEPAPMSQPVLAQAAPKRRPVRLGEVEETPRPEPEAPTPPRTPSASAPGTPSPSPMVKPAAGSVRSPLALLEPTTPSRGKEAKDVQAQAAPENRPAKPRSEPASAPEISKRPTPAPEAVLPPPPPTHAASPATPSATPPPLTHPVIQGAQATSLLPATPAAPAHPVVIQVGDSLKWILRQASTSAELQLHPENLGKVTIQLKVEGTQVHAKVWATEASTLPVLQDHRAYLEVSLRQQGLHLGSFDLQQGHRGHQPFGETPSRPAFAPPFEEKGALARQETPSTLAPAFASSHRIEVLA